MRPSKDPIGDFMTALRKRALVQGTAKDEMFGVPVEARRMGSTKAIFWMLHGHRRAASSVRADLTLAARAIYVRNIERQEQAK